MLRIVEHYYLITLGFFSANLALHLPFFSKYSSALPRRNSSVANASSSQWSSSTVSISAISNAVPLYDNHTSPTSPSTAFTPNVSVLLGLSNSSESAAGKSSAIAAASTPISTAYGNAPARLRAAATSTADSPEPTAQSPEPDCTANPPIGNYTRYIDQFASTYDIRCGLRVDGDRADTATHADSFVRCLQYCSLLDKCVAVTYRDGNNADNDNSNCYPYYTFRGYNTTASTSLHSGVNVDGP